MKYHLQRHHQNVSQGQLLCFSSQARESVSSLCLSFLHCIFNKSRNYPLPCINKLNLQLSRNYSSLCRNRYKLQSSRNYPLSYWDTLTADGWTSRTTESKYVKLENRVNVVLTEYSKTVELHVKKL